MNKERRVVCTRVVLILGVSLVLAAIIGLSPTVVAQSQSSDATLSGLTLSSVDFGTFATGTISYTASVASTVTETTVTPTTNNSGASYAIMLGGVTDDDGEISLSAGSNVITVEVTAEDGQTTRSYTVTVTRPASTDATLSALTLSEVDFGTFASDTTTYTANVANRVTETTVTPTVNHIGASYVTKLGGVEDTDDTVPLSVGSNVITIEVTAEDENTTHTYTVTVTRAENTPATGKPTISGTAEVGETLTVDTSSIADVDGMENASLSITFYGNYNAERHGGWLLGGGRSYEVHWPAVGTTISAVVSFNDEAGNSERLVSIPTARVPGPMDSITLVDAYDQSDVATLGAAELSIVLDANGSYAFRLKLAADAEVGKISWRLNFSDTREENSAPYSLYGYDENGGLTGRGLPVGEHSLKVKAYSDSGDQLQGMTVSFTVAHDTPATGAPSISGTAQVSQTLTASTSGITDADGLTNVSYSYQWLADDTEIDGATNSTYKVQASDVGKVIKVRVDFRDDAKTRESLISEGTTAVVVGGM